MEIRKSIPAFFMWKEFNDTIPMINSESIEHVEGLTNMLKSASVTELYFYNTNKLISSDENNEIIKKYKSFTTWLLGRLFYLSSNKKNARVHHLLIDAQKRILHKIEITHCDMYQELSVEYLKVLKQLNNFVKNDLENIQLIAFVPAIYDDLKKHLDWTPLFVEINTKETCFHMQKVVLKIIQQICLEKFEFYDLNSDLIEFLDNLLIILFKSPIHLKIQVLEIYSKILNINDEFSHKINAILNNMFAYFEQLLYTFLNDKNRIKYGNFETICSNILNQSKNIKDKFKIRTISNFIIKKKLEFKIEIPDKLFKFACTNYSGDEFDLDCNVFDLDVDILILYKKQIFNEILVYIENLTNYESQSLLINYKVSKTWFLMYSNILEKLLTYNCIDNCLLNFNLVVIKEIIKHLLDINVLIKNNNLRLVFFEEIKFVPLLLSHIVNHTQNCEISLDYQSFNEILLNLMLLCDVNNFDLLFHLTNYAFLKPLIYKTDFNMPETLIGYSNVYEIKKHIRHIYTILGQINLEKAKIIENLCFFASFYANQKDNFGSINDYLIKICRNIIEGQDIGLKSLLCDNIPLLFAVYADVEEFRESILMPLLNSDNLVVLKKITKIMVACTSMLFVKHAVVFKMVDYTIKYSIVIKLDQFVENAIALKEYEAKVDCNFNTGHLFKICLKLTQFNDEDIQINALLLLPIWSKHVHILHKIKLTDYYLNLIDNPSYQVRNKFAGVIYEVMNYAQNTDAFNTQIKNELIETTFLKLLAITKKSLQSNFELQETLLKTIRNISAINNALIPIKVMKLLLYFIMMPTSQQPCIAVNIFLELPKKHNLSLESMKLRNRKDFYKTLINLCAINQAIADYTLSTSLRKTSLMLGYFGPTDFIAQETRYLLPYLVALVVKMPDVEKLIQEMAYMYEVDVPELLTNEYAYIFMHIYLNDYNNDTKKALLYVERKTGLDGSVLRKTHFMKILNELLLNFNDKKESVMRVLTHFAQEECANQKHASIPEYIQPHLLGVLQFFDVKLFAQSSDKENILLSLAQIIEYLGPVIITPLRFKIIAMLRSVLNLNFPEVICDAWNVFVRSCDIEVLGPQLSTIFISILPLRLKNPEKIDNIFKYLIIENEAFVKDYIVDLYFACDYNIDAQLIDFIKKHLKPIDAFDFKTHLKFFMKYLTYETVHVRIYAIQYIRKLLEKYREELDLMILGYNGIDKVIVELLDMLTLGCRENDAALRLACGECIGELGAIEPSHLPRRYGENGNTFTFFITDDIFIANSLNEMIRALQSQNNTQKVDSFSLAIQDTLKYYDISSNPDAQKHNVWNEFPESHHALMLPLLSSKYTRVQVIADVTVSPIYGSNFGSNFQLWIYNWTVFLFSTIKSERKVILQAYMPSLKHDHKFLMLFLPHFLFISLTEGTQNNQKLAYDEFMAVINSQTTGTLVDNILDVRPIRANNYISFNNEPIKSGKIEEYTKIAFILLDFLERWLREWIWEKGFSGRDDVNYKCIKLFLSRFCKLQLAKCNFECGEYPRALMYLEDYIAKNPSKINENLSLLADIYYRLDEPDGVAGVTALRQTEPSLEERILALEVSGKLSDAAACYERISLPLNLFHIQGLIRCYLDLDNVNTALNFAQGALIRQPDYNNWMLEAQAEPLWRLGRYDDLDNLLKKPELKNNDSWGVQIGQALIHLKNGGREEFKSTLATIKSMQVNSLGAASLEEGAYQHGYQYIARLHALNELEQVEKVVYELLLRPNDHNAITNVIKRLKLEWDLRIKVVQESVRITEPILCLRRVAIEGAKQLIKDKVPFSVMLFDELLGESWLRSAEIARAAEVHQQAYTYILKAEQYAPPKLFLEKAKLHWMREEHEQSLTTLKRGLSILFPTLSQSSGLSSNSKISPSANFSLEQKKICAEAKLLIATYNDDISNVDTEVNIQNYKEAMEMFREWEKSLVCLAQYYDRVFQNYSDEDKDIKGSDMQIHMINYFGKSLQYGSNFVYQSMPRLLSIWFDYGTRLLDVTSSKIKDERKSNLLKMTKLIDTFLERLPAYIFLTAFSQLVSRICHPQKEVYIELKLIIIKLILQYPQQSLWMIISVIKSSYSVRSKRCGEILSDGRLKTPTMIKYLTDFTKLAEKLIELCNKEISDSANTVSISAILRALPRMLTKDDFSEIMIPTQMFRKLVLPNPDFHNSEHNAFPNHYVHIIGISDEMVILPSLQRPRRISLRGSDGKLYLQLLKPKDDLRKDFRLMEFNDIVNQMLSREADSRQMRLNIRLYSVAPLNEECGLIEWIPNLVGIRPACLMLYKQRGLGMKGKELKENCCKQTDSLEKKKSIFINKLLPKHPAVLGEWFRKTFPDAQGWLTARTNYIRTTAVISMVGYILGLGDRHGENILLDSSSGDTIHVDFNCLFNKGETFEWPERVPFRLTQNMVGAMGPLGVEGVFRKSCACTLRVLRNHTNTLMSIVTPFVYDPLVSWPRNAPVATNAHNSERTNELAVTHISYIEHRLQGQVQGSTKSRSFSIPLSVEGQTNKLILEAMSVQNLCQMYIGWGPYL